MNPPSRQPTPRRAKLDELIHRTNDPEKREMLMLLISLDSALMSTMKSNELMAGTFEYYKNLFEKHVDKFNEQVATEQKILFGIKSAWWLATGMVAVILVLGAFILRTQLSSIDENAVQVHVNAIDIVIMKSALAELQRRQSRDDDMFERHGTKDR